MQRCSLASDQWDISNVQVAHQSDTACPRERADEHIPLLDDRASQRNGDQERSHSGD